MKTKKVLKKITKKSKELETIKNDAYKNLKKTRKLPDDPSIGQDIFNDGILNQNPHLKSDQLESYNHTIGYCEGIIYELKNIVYFLTVTKKQYKKDQKENRKIKKMNKATMKNLKQKLFGHGNNKIK